MTRAFEETLNLQWRDDDTTKLIFHIADAPPHAARYQEHANLIGRAAREGVVVFPVAASGVSYALEYFMRHMAQASSGEYVFLTDDSGIGNAHEEPTIPCYYVRPFKQLIVDLALGEVRGTRRVPDENDIIRTVGDVDNEGVCTVESGDDVTEARLY